VCGCGFVAILAAVLSLVVLFKMLLSLAAEFSFLRTFDHMNVYYFFFPWPRLFLLVMLLQSASLQGRSESSGPRDWSKCQIPTGDSRTTYGLCSIVPDKVLMEDQFLWTQSRHVFDVTLLVLKY
jgi:hypothetical protein